MSDNHKYGFDPLINSNYHIIDDREISGCVNHDFIALKCCKNLS